MQAAAAALDPDEQLTVGRYRNWRAQQADIWRFPSKFVFGDSHEWLEWCRRAGIDGGLRCRRQRYGDVGLLEHLIAAGGGKAPIARRKYDVYRRAHPDAPHWATIVGRYGSWVGAQKVAADLIASRLDPVNGLPT